MAEVIIASHKWRKRTRDFSALCDNVLKLDRTYSLVNDPMKLNRYGICAPDCEMCITPESLVGEVPCDFRDTLARMMVLPPPPPAEIKIPSSLNVQILGDSLISNVDASTWFSTKCLRVGQSLPSVIARSQTQNFVLRNPGSLPKPSTLVSDWATFGEVQRRLNYRFVRSGVEIANRTAVFKCTYEIRFVASIGIPTATKCGFGVGMETRVKVGSTSNVYTGFTYTIFPNLSDDVEYNFYGIWLPRATNEPQTDLVGVDLALQVGQPYIQNRQEYLWKWEPFTAFDLAMVCGPYKLMELVTYDVVCTQAGTLGNVVTDSLVTTSPASPTSIAYKTMKRGA
jgi:hypothetical protein